MFIYYDMAAGDKTSFNYVTLMGFIAAAVILVVIKMFLTRRKKK